MVVVIIGMLVCIALALAVIVLVALPAHRDGQPFIDRPSASADDMEQGQGVAPRERETVDA